jgi:hypothetical protein
VEEDVLWTTDVMERPCAVARGIDITSAQRLRSYSDPFFSARYIYRTEIKPGIINNILTPE